MGLAIDGPFKTEHSEFFIGKFPIILNYDKWT